MIIGSVISFTAVQVSGTPHFKYIHAYFALIAELIFVVSLIGGPGLLKALKDFPL